PPTTSLFPYTTLFRSMATGQLPFQGKHTMALLTSLALDHPPAPAKLNPAIPLALSKLIQRLLAKGVADRPASARAVVQAIEVIEDRKSTRLNSSHQII